MEKKIIAEGFSLAESPLWDNESQTLYWTDILDKKIYYLKEGIQKYIDIGEEVGYIGLCEDKNLLLAMETGIYTMDRKSCNLKKIFSFDRKGFRCNDGEIDSLGRLLIGRMNKGYNDGSAPFTYDGSLYMIEKKLNRILLEKVSISNGITWSRDGKTMFYVDSLTQAVRAYNYDQKTGTISNPKIIFSVEDAFPDGITSDIEGNLWIALYGGSRVICIDPENGKVQKEIQLEHKNPASCIFGGSDYSTLFITCAADGERKGCIYSLKTSTKGYAPNKFKTGDDN